MPGEYNLPVARYEELTITLPDGYEAYARYWRADPCRGAVLSLHGIQSHGGWFEGSAEHLQRAGFAVLQPDRRGAGRNLVDRGHAESAEQLVADAFACLDTLVDRSGVSRPQVLGISWGGKLAAVMHVTEPTRIAGLALVTPGLFPRSGVSREEKFRIGCAMLSNPEKLFDIPLNVPELLARDPLRIRYIQQDPLQLRQATAGFYLASRRMDRTLRALGKATPIPLHVFLAADEGIIDNDETCEFIRGLGWKTWAITTYERSRHTIEFDEDRDRFLADLVNCISTGP